MDPRLIYLIITVLLVGDAIALYLINRQRISLDLKTDDGRKKDQGLKIAMIMVPVQTVLVIGVLWAIFQPPLVLPN